MYKFSSNPRFILQNPVHNLVPHQLNVSCAIGQAWLNTLHMKPCPDGQISTWSVDNFQLKQFVNLFPAVNIDNVSMFCEAIF